MDCAIGFLVVAVIVLLPAFLWLMASRDGINTDF